MGISEAVAESRLAGLLALRAELAGAIEQRETDRDLDKLSARLMVVLADIESLQAAADAASGAKGTPLDELKARRAARMPGADSVRKARGSAVAR